MKETDPEDLRKACRKERDPGVGARMAAASMVCVKKVDAGDAADYLMQCHDRVTYLARRFEGGHICPPEPSPQREARRPRFFDLCHFFTQASRAWG